MADEEAQAEAVGRWMEQQDRFARLLGIELEASAPGYSRVALQVTGDMLNAVGMTHGGVTFSLADFAFAVASNTHGQVAVALTAQISFPAASRQGERLIAEARELNKSSRTGLYSVEVRTEEGRLVGLFTGNVYRRSDAVSNWIEGEQQ